MQAISAVRQFRRPAGHDSAAAMSKLVALLPNYMQIVQNWSEKGVDTYAYLGCLISVTSGHRLWYYRGMSIISQFEEMKYLKYSLDTSILSK